MVAVIDQLTVGLSIGSKALKPQGACAWARARERLLSIGGLTEIPATAPPSPLVLARGLAPGPMLSVDPFRRPGSFPAPDYGPLSALELRV